MTEKPELEKDAYGDIIEPPFDPSNIPSFDPMEEFKDRGQLQERRDGTKHISMKAETPAERIEREERDALFWEAIKKDQMEEEKELNKRARY